MNVRGCVEFNMKKYNKIKEKINNLEEINFTAKEFHLIFEMAGFDLLSNSEMRSLILAFCEKIKSRIIDKRI
jgi:hypothetical protein